MSSYSLKTRSLVSTWFSLIILLLLSLYLGFIEFFQDSRIELASDNKITSPIQKDFLDKVHVIRFKNKLGRFAIKKENKDWLMYEPRVIPAKLSTIEDILNQLKNIKVQTVHEYEKLNLQNFSLETPIIEVDLVTKQQNKLNIKLGIINRIDGTTYMTISGHNLIFQTSMFKSHFESFELSDFIDSKVFSIHENQIKRISIYHGKNSSPNNVLEYKEDNWLSKKYKVISNENTFKKVKSILDIKTHMIIDKSNEELESFINNYLASPLYRIVIQTKNKQTIVYKISTLTKAINELKIEKRQYFIMSASNRPYPFLITKNYLERFIVRYADLRR